MEKTVIGVYGEMAGSFMDNASPSLSFRNSMHTDLEKWRTGAASAVKALVLEPELPSGFEVQVTCRGKYEWDGLTIEELSWKLPFGPPAEALFLKPAGVNKRLPGVLALHDHGAKKFWGYRKIARGKVEPPGLVKRHHEELYGGLCWANELAKEGFAVLVHDTFPFASRRVRAADVSEGARRGYPVEEPETDVDIERYNDWAFGHEHDMAKSLFAAGTTWPGVTLREDRIALDILSSRDDVDETRLGCGGLSGGGMRTVFLAGLDKRISCAFDAGFMTTWRDFSLYSGWTHTWMTFVPGLPGKLDFPEVLGLRVPLPVMVLNNIDDSLYTLEEMKRADRILRDVYRKAGAEDMYRCSFYPGAHKFDRKMQRDAFSWLKRWLG